MRTLYPQPSLTNHVIVTFSFCFNINLSYAKVELIFSTSTATTRSSAPRLAICTPLI
jgi:hypothetical protein